MYNKCPCCKNKPITFWKKATTGIFRQITCQECGCKLKQNPYIAIFSHLLQWMSLPLGALVGIDIFGSSLERLQINPMAILLTSVTLGMVLAGAISMIILNVFVPWNQIKDKT